MDRFVTVVPRPKKRPHQADGDVSDQSEFGQLQAPYEGLAVDVPLEVSVADNSLLPSARSSGSSGPAKKGKENQNRIFQNEWTEDFFVIPSPTTGLPVCLLCARQINLCKKYNVQRHFSTHKEYEERYPSGSQARSRFIAQCINDLQMQRSGISAALTENQLLALASYEVSFILAKQAKPFSDAEFVKNATLRFMSTLLRGKSYRENVLELVKKTPIRSVIF